MNCCRRRLLTWHSRLPIGSHVLSSGSSHPFHLTRYSALPEGKPHEITRRNPNDQQLTLSQPLADNGLNLVFFGLRHDQLSLPLKHSTSVDVALLNFAAKARATLLLQWRQAGAGARGQFGAKPLRSRSRNAVKFHRRPESRQTLSSPKSFVIQVPTSAELY